MGRRRSAVSEGPKPNDEWVYRTEIQINGRNVNAGTELKIKGVRGRFRFVKMVTTAKAEWIDVWGGPKGSECMRSFYLDKVKTVHYKNQTVKNLAVEYKQKLKDKKQELVDENGDA
jgi:hypothetical protein